MDFFEEVKKRVDGGIIKYGSERHFQYQTAYELPFFYALTDKKITTLKELSDALEPIRNNPLWMLFCAEAYEALNSIEQKNGFIPDSFLRKIGASLVDGRVTGIAVVIGSSEQDCDVLIKDLQEKNFLILIAGPIVEQLEEKKVKMGADRNLAPLGIEAVSIMHWINLAVRIGLSFGGLKRGDKDGMSKYLANKIPSFIIQLGAINDDLREIMKELICLNLAVVSDQNVPEDIGFSEQDHSKIIQKAIETKAIKVNVEKIDIPISYSMAFEGERIRKPEIYVEAGGGKTISFELVKMLEPESVTDNKIEVIGPDLDKIQEGSLIPIGILVEIAGKNMQEMFESVIERKIHDFINYGEGLMHVAQRNFVWLRISKEVFKKGFQLKHIGEILRKRILSEFPGIVDKAQVTIFSDEKAVAEKLEFAKQEYLKRDSRLKGMTDESVDKFYTCSLCQSFAPTHICIITPERLGLCGGINWLDAKTSHEINPNGPNQVVEKGDCSNQTLGIWENVDKVVKKYTQNKIDGFCMYSLMNKPCTSCGCFECIVAVIPECNGVLVVDREFDGQTPIGLKFTSLAGEIGGGIQTPGFLGIGKLFLLSSKFMQAEGGIRRIVWMPSKLKEFIKNNIDYDKLGLEKDFFEKVADETATNDIKQVLDFMGQKKHPATSMDPLAETSTSASEEKQKKFTHVETSELQDTKQRFIAAEILTGKIEKNSVGSFDIEDKVSWAKQAVAAGAQILYVRLNSIDPDDENQSADEIFELINQIKTAVNVPLIVIGCGNTEKDIQVFEKIAPILDNGFIGNADEDNYKTYAGLSIAHKTGVVAFSNIDFNIAKQVNTLLRETGVNTNKIIMDPLAGALGYGLEYTYSVIERIVLAGKAGDIILKRPILFNAAKAWDTRESKEYGPVWEKVTASAGIYAGANIIIARHSESLKYLKNVIKDVI
jgi:acetyl-CoA synthase